ncbi:beta glucosidase [Cavenderia fasciculata]|uniref:beta-glucosidase n=1 Tax=Cavenderia fasciculata TaxID=261658 RepID=F4Q457_CACFS|nr:beta glucosidase [Cavenderia fasciculata]EGG17759.1 beta glucosidase [Cavenderia fasciculata]|eukprot:XP_004356243.1 beta glucosidase [Cavenderia fasciculata]
MKRLFNLFIGISIALFAIAFYTEVSVALSPLSLRDISVGESDKHIHSHHYLKEAKPTVFNHKRTVSINHPEYAKNVRKPANSDKFLKERDSFVDRLMSKMSITEKIGQMTQLDITTLTTIPGTIDINATTLEYICKTFYVGSFLNSPVSGGVVGNDIYTINSTTWMSMIQTIQEATIAASPNKIPMIYGLDSIHGANYIHEATLFPQGTGMGATFNPDIAHAGGEISAKDTSSVGIPWIFAPVLGIGVQPLWPRIYETFGEDPLVAAVMGAATVAGLQGDNNPFTSSIKPPSVVATAKHFFGYSDPASGKDRTPAWIPERMLRRYFLPSFAAAIGDAGAGTVMINSGEVNGIPMHADKKYLNDVLRNELTFEGVAVTDWEDIEKLVYFHHVAADEPEAILMALDAGVDMSMVPLDYSFPIILKQLVDEGRVEESRLDVSVRRILNLKYALGLFTNPYPNPQNPYLGTIGCFEDRQVAMDAVGESVTLLQNKNNVLPLDPSKISNILLTGPSVDSLRNQNGGWSIHWQGAVNDAEIPYGSTILDGVLNYFNGSQSSVTYQPGTQVGVLNQTMIDQAVAAAVHADAVIIALGELPEAETPGDISDLEIDIAQSTLLQAIRAATTAPIILVIIEARPRVFDPLLIAQIDAVLMAYLPGSDGGQPIADIIFGKINPSGRLPLTYPAFTGDIGVPYYHKYSVNGVTAPLFEFGTGLSYTNFTYTDICSNATAIGGANYTAQIGDYVSISINVTNIGQVEGKDSVLLYLSDLYAQVTPEVKMLRSFTKVDLVPQQSVQVEFVLQPYDFSFIGIDNTAVIESGQFVIAIGDQQIWLNLL